MANNKTGKQPQMEAPIGEGELTVTERFMQLDGAYLVVPPYALEISKQMRALELLMRLSGDGHSEGETVDVVADFFDWIRENAVKDRSEFDAFWNEHTLNEALEYTSTYMGALGELLGSGK